MVTAELLRPLLRRHVDPAATCAEPVRAAAGNGQETWLVDATTPAGERPLVLRRSAPDGTLGWTDRRAEFAALRAVAGTGLPVPRVLWLDEDGGALGRPYFVMERLPGRVPGRPAGADRDRVSRELGAALARLHAVDPSVVDGLTRHRDGRTAALAELAAWQRRYHEDRLAPIPLLGALFAWLEAQAPAGGGPVRILWGDAGPHNLLVHDGRITGMLDWELVHLGDPLDDLAVAQWSCFATLDPELVLAGYEAETGAPVDRDALRWYRVLACCSRATMLLAGVRAYAQARTASPSLAGLGLDLLSRTLTQGAAEAGWAGPDDEPRRPAADGADGHGGAGARPDSSEIADGVARFLSADVLPATDDAALRRGLKTAVALLETAALRARTEPALLDARATRRADALTAPGLASDDLEAAARACELDPARSADRTAIRALLLAEHADADALLHPLRRLFES